MEIFDRTKVKVYPLSERKSKTNITETAINPDNPKYLSLVSDERIKRIALEIKKAKENGM